MNDELDDIAIALIRLRAAFAKHGIPCPDTFEYSDVGKAYDAAVRLRLAAQASTATWTMDQAAKPWAEMTVAGFTMRFEARKIERPGTGVDFDDGVTGRVFQTKR